MNARYYVPTLNRFASADTIVPNPSNPQSFNRYSYSYNNPVKFSDPTGHDPAWCGDIYESQGDPACNHSSSTQSSGTQYDLTGWLPGAMRRGALAEELNPMREAAFNALMEEGLTQSYWSTIWATELVTTFNTLNTRYGQWDVKREIKDQLREGIILCSGATCRWVDYSTPGNILYGFVAASAGVGEDLSRLAGGTLELIEGEAEWDNRGNSFEDPFDSAAVNFGYQLFEDFGPNMTNEEFFSALTVDILESFQPPPEGFVPHFPAGPQSNNYSVGAFDCFPENGCIAP